MLREKENGRREFLPEIMEGKYDEKKGSDLLEIACVTNEEILYLLDSGDQVELWSIPLTQKDSTDEVQIEEKKLIFHTQNMIDILYTDRDYIAYKELSAYKEFDRTKQKKMVINAIIKKHPTASWTILTFRQHNQKTGMTMGQFCWRRMWEKINTPKTYMCIRWVPERWSGLPKPTLPRITR